MSQMPRNYTILFLNLCGAVTALVYLIMIALQQGGNGLGLYEFLLAEFVLVVLWLGAFGASREYSGIRWLLLWAVIFRVIGLWGSPILEDDWYRYLWDGYRFVTDGTPYGIAPSSFFATDNLPDRFVEIVGQINNPDLPTIYGPTLQYLFALAYLISPGELWGLKLIMLIADLGVIAILLRLAPMKYVLLYAWCPLVIKEIAFTAHPDGIGVFLLLAALFLRLRHFYAAAVVVAALAIAAKVFAVLIMPWLLWRLAAKYWLLFALVLLAVYLPFLMQGASDFYSLFVFAQHWEFNAAIYAVVNNFVPDNAAKLLLAIVFLAWLAVYFFKSQKPEFSMPRVDWVFALFLLIAPVINAWYWLWVLPFAVIFPSFWAWTVSVALLLSYCVGLHIPGSELDAYEMPIWIRSVEFALIAVAVAIDMQNRRKIVSAERV
ncbi:MAG: hypothetical protein COC05_00105 [Gammaproteobacteria bacterium]|nr:MAG: hypothetical protein COC05_00105 [Gammaproteobacteria bacterium]